MTFQHAQKHCPVAPTNQSLHLLWLEHAVTNDVGVKICSPSGEQGQYDEGRLDDSSQASSDPATSIFEHVHSKPGKHGHTHRVDAKKTIGNAEFFETRHCGVKQIE